MTMASIEERLVELINLASIESDGNKKVEYLYQVKEFALNHGLLNNFFQDILAFQNDRAPGVKKFVLAFIEAACKSDSQLCPKAILSLNLLLNDTNNEVIKRSIQAATQFYRTLVQWIAKFSTTTDEVKVVVQNTDQQQQQQLISSANPQNEANTINYSDIGNVARVGANNIGDELEKVWLMWLQIQNSICTLLDTTNNDGVRTHCVKFIETIVLMQTPSDKYTDQSYELNLIDPKITPVKLSDEAMLCRLVGLPQNGVIFNEEHKLELVEVAKKRFEQLVVFHGTSHISSVNLMATMQSLVILAKQRYRLFMGRVIQAMESLNNKLPPTLTESQVQSVKKFLKLQLTVMLKHPYSLDRYQLQITQLLQAVGSKQPEIHRVINDFKNKFGCDPPIINNNITQQDIQKRIKLEPGIKHEQKPQVGSQSSLSSQPGHIGKAKHLDLNKLTQELDEKEKRLIVIESVKRILSEEKCGYILPSQMDIKKKVLSTVAYEFYNTECPKIIQDYIFNDIRHRHEICYSIIRKHYDLAAAKAAKRQIDLLDHPELLKNYFACFEFYLSRAMSLKDESEKEMVLNRLYALRAEYYSLSNPDPEQEQEVEVGDKEMNK